MPSKSLTAAADASFERLRAEDAPADKVRGSIEAASEAELVKRFLPLAQRMAARFGGDEDALGDALEGLVRAAKRYDPNRGPFAGYAELMIRQRLSRERKRRALHADTMQNADGLDTADGGRTPAEAAETRAEMRRALDDALRGVPPEEAERLRAEAEFFIERDGAPVRAAALARGINRAQAAAANGSA